MADQALARRGGERGAQRHHHVGDRRVGDPLALLVLVTEPVHEAGELVGGDVSQLQPLGEVAVGVAPDQPPVFVAGVLAEAAALAAVALDPLVEVGQERDRRVRLQHAPVAVALAAPLDPPRLLVGAGAPLALLARHFDHGDVADGRALAVDPPVHARGLGLSQPPLVATASISRRGRRILGNAYEHSPREPGRAVPAVPLASEVGALSRGAISPRRAPGDLGAALSRAIQRARAPQSVPRLPPPTPPRLSPPALPRRRGRGRARCR